MELNKEKVSKEIVYSQYPQNLGQKILYPLHNSKHITPIQKDLL